jgi:hypothetical protein
MDGDNESLLAGEEGDPSDYSQSSGGASQGALQPSGGTQVPPSPQNAPQGALPGGGVASTNDDDQQMPQVSGRALFMGNLLKTILSGGLAGAAQGSPGMARGYAAQQQAVQNQRNQQEQAQQQANQNMAALDAHQTHLLQMHTIQMQQAVMAHNMIHLDDGHNQNIVDSLEKSTTFDRKEGLMEDEHEVDGEGMSAYSNAVKLAGQLNGKQGTDSQSRYKVGVLDGTDLGHLKFNVYKANMNGRVTRDVFTGLDDKGQPNYQPLTGNYTDLDSLEQANRSKVTQDATKDLIKTVMQTLGKPESLPKTQVEADGRMGQLNSFVKLTEKNNPQASQVAQSEIDSIKKMYPNLPKNEAALKAADRAPKPAFPAGKYYTYTDPEGTHLTTGDKLPEGADSTPIKDPQQFMAGAHAANTVQQSLNRLHQNIDEHPELFDDPEARDIVNSATGDIDKAGAGAAGVSIALPQTFWDKLSTRAQNSINNPTTRAAVQQYVADYKAAKDKALVMQMEMQGGKIGRGGAQAFASIIGQLPGGNTATSEAARRQMDDLQQTQDELSKEYPERYQEFKKEPVYQRKNDNAPSANYPKQKPLRATAPGKADKISYDGGKTWQTAQ